MYRKGELVEVKEHRLKTHTTAIGSSWDVIWLSERKERSCFDKFFDTNDIFLQEKFLQYFNE